MSSLIINKIELQNWFNYKGGFENNVIDFKEGLNILTGDNNAGKTKLHNAFRWILEDEVIINKSNEAVKESISNNNLRKVVNHTTFRETALDTQVKIGVRLTFTKKRKNDAKTYILTKIFDCRKQDDNNLIKVNETKRVQQIINNNPRSISDDFDKMAKMVIPNAFINFYLIEGEQLGNITPLEGSELKNTINAIVSLHELDFLEKKSKSLSKEADKSLDVVIGKESDQNSAVSEANILIISLKEELEDEKESEINLRGELDKNKKLMLKYQKKAESSQKLKNLITEHQRLKSNLDFKEEKEVNEKLKYISNFIDKDTFSISKLFDDKPINENLEKQLSNIKGFISQRKLEIDTGLDKNEQRMILSLEKSQPKPEILEEMVKESHCYVCDSEMDESSKNYIENKLIPFFRDESESDEILDKLNDVHSFFRNIFLDTKKYYEADTEFFEIHSHNILEIVNNKIDANQELKDFEKDNGFDFNDDENSDVNIDTYTTAVQNHGEALIKINESKEEQTRLTELIKEQEKIIGANSKTGSKKLQKTQDFKFFSKDLYDFLNDFKKKEYLEFAKKLSENATRRFQQLLQHNTAKNNKVKVEATQRADGEFDFEIKIVNNLGETQDQAGGADQALRRVSVIFALLDLAENKNGYPFIADAPISRLSEDNKKEFFMTLLKDFKDSESSIKQSIIMTMDLVSAKKSKKSLILNNLGEQILSEIKNEDETSFISIFNNKIDYIKNN